MGLACGGILEVIGIVSNSSFDLMLAMELKVRFWHDLWQGETSFKDRYPTLYQIVLNGDAMIADYLEFGNGQLHWNLLFHQALQDWEAK